MLESALGRRLATVGGTPMFAMALPFLGGIGAPELIICGCIFIVPLLVVAVLAGQSNRSRHNAAPMVVPTAPPSWLPDPTTRHQLRYWDGLRWTAWVSDDGVQSQDPV